MLQWKISRQDWTETFILKTCHCPTKPRFLGGRSTPTWKLTWHSLEKRRFRLWGALFSDSMFISFQGGYFFLPKNPWFSGKWGCLQYESFSFHFFCRSFCIEFPRLWGRCFFDLGWWYCWVIPEKKTPWNSSWWFFSCHHVIMSQKFIPKITMLVLCFLGGNIGPFSWIVHQMLVTIPWKWRRENQCWWLTAPPESMVLLGFAFLVTFYIFLQIVPMVKVNQVPPFFGEYLPICWNFFQASWNPKMEVDGRWCSLSFWWFSGCLAVSFRKWFSPKIKWFWFFSTLDGSEIQNNHHWIYKTHRK